MIRILGTIFAGLLGLAFGSFLNVCLSRWPQGESVVRPRSHCRHCDHTLAWWENVPVVSWLALRGRCRICRAWIGWRYPLVELAVGGLWALVGWRLLTQIQAPDIATQFVIGRSYFGFIPAIGTITFLWLLVGIAVLDAEHFWIADAVTMPGIALGFAFPIFCESLLRTSLREQSELWIRIGERLLEVLAAAGLILLIRWLYWLVRRREGIGLGDAKLMALLAAWLGLPGALLAFGLGIVLGALAAVVLLAVPSARRDSETWAFSKLPLGTFLCIGGIVSSLWGQPIIATYLRWAGF
jgi:leader peptidase (prepilin peptidase)/N-methyltransferase